MNFRALVSYPSRRYLGIVLLGTLLNSATAADDNFTPQMVPRPAPATSAPYSPQAVLPGGIVLPLFPADSPYLNAKRITEAEKYEMQPQVPGRVHSIVNIHNPSIEIYPVEASINTGAAIIIIPGGGHKTLMIAGGGSDFVPFFYNYGITCIILRNRLRADGYVAETDAVYDAQQAVRLVRFHAKRWGIDPHKIGVMGFSAGGELASRAGIFYETFDAVNQGPADPLANTTSRPDFVGLIYTGPTPFTQKPDQTFPRGVPPVFIAAASYGSARHTVWATDYYMAMLKKEIPNIEMHLYGNGGHGGGLKDRGGIPFGTWQDRFIDWFRDLGFLAKIGIPTKADTDIKASLAKP